MARGTAGVRDRITTALLVLAGLAHAFLPFIVRSDGTDVGGREMFLRAVPGSVYSVLCVALLSCACGLLARERESNRLALAVVRPVSAFTVVLGKLLALVAVAAIVLAFNSALTCARGGWKGCVHVYEPVLEPPEIAARRAMEEMLKDTNTPQEVRSAPRHTLLTILTGREIDRYDTVPASHAIQWPFASEAANAATGLVARIRFSTQFNTRAEVSGAVTFGPWSSPVSNNTQSIIELPLLRTSSANAEGPLSPFVFSNKGTSSVMLRPRCDIQVLSPADSFAMNILRASCEMLFVIAFLCAFGLFLSSALSRPVAIFTALLSAAVAKRTKGYTSPLSFVLLGISLLLPGMTKSLFAIGLALILASAAKSQQMPTVIRQLSAIPDDRLRASAMALKETFVNIGYFLSPTITAFLGRALGDWSPSAVYFGSGACALAIGVLMIAIEYLREKRGTEGLTIR